MLAPFTPFIADEMYANLLFGEETALRKPVDEWTSDDPDSVHLCDFPDVREGLIDPQLEAGMDAVRRTVELGRAARAQAKVKLRQPLRKAVVVASDAEREAIERLADVVASELNVKELDFVHDRGRAGLLPRQAQLPVARTALRKEHAAGRRGGRGSRRRGGRGGARERGGGRRSQVDGKDHTPDGRRRQPRDGAARGLPGGGRGRPRRRPGAGPRRRAAPRGPGTRGRSRGPGGPQAGRASRSPTASRSRLGGDEELLSAAREHEAYIAGETLATSVDYGADGAGEKATIEGRELRIAVSKA